MQSRIDFQKTSQGALHAMLALENYVRKSSGLEPALLDLVRMRASQINGCAYCIGMHTDEALRDGEPPERLTLLDAWPEADIPGIGPARDCPAAMAADGIEALP